MQALETQLQIEFDKLGIEEPNKFSVLSFLHLLRLKDEPTYTHSIRVGILGSRIGQEVPTLDSKALFYPGLLHDVGKLLVPMGVLQKKEGFGAEDFEKIKPHAQNSKAILNDIFKWSALVSERHHYFQANGYPVNLSEFPSNLSKGTEVLVNYYARILSLIDSYDAASIRENNKFGEECRRLKPEEVRDMMFKNNPDQKKFLTFLYDKGLFGDYDLRKAPVTSFQPDIMEVFEKAFAGLGNGAKKED